MAFIIHLHLGNEQADRGSEAASATRAEAAGRRSDSGWWRHRWSSLREYEEHLHRTFGPLADGRERAVCADEASLEDSEVLEIDDLCEDADGLTATG